ncbi:hypothetical protein AB0G76_35345 [Streptomyces asoensis]|uniref:hypothetical protein n=1 Tax=Streptomyces asoensis TaxID=249586 RepID=UPI0033D8C9D3
MAFWQGEVPASRREAAKMNYRLYEEHLDGEEPAPPVSIITEFLSVLTERWPDRNVGEDTPWTSIPLSAGASGSYVYIALACSTAEMASAHVAQVANQ